MTNSLDILMLRSILMVEAFIFSFSSNALYPTEVEVAVGSHQRSGESNRILERLSLSLQRK